MKSRAFVTLFWLYLFTGLVSLAQEHRAFLPTRTVAVKSGGTPSGKTKIIIDTDIGDDIDDAFALALAVASPELEIVGVTTAWGNTDLRARLAGRFLSETGHGDVPVAIGIPTHSKTAFSQARYAESGPANIPHLLVLDFLIDQIRKNPDEVTLVAIAPLTNVAAVIERDPATFRKLRGVVLMGGSIRRGYGDLGYTPDRGPQPEYNIFSDVASAQKVFAAGVPIAMMPLDSTQLKLDEVQRAILFAAGTPLTDALTVLYYQWGRQTPTLFDVMTIAYLLNPSLCPVQPMHIEVDKDGFTRSTAGAPNASVCLNSDSDQVFHFVLPRLMGSGGAHVQTALPLVQTPAR